MFCQKLAEHVDYLLSSGTRSKADCKQMTSLYTTQQNLKAGLTRASLENGKEDQVQSNRHKRPPDLTPLNFHLLD